MQNQKHTIIMTHDYILFYCFVKLDVLCLALCFNQDVDRVFIKSSMKVKAFKRKEKANLILPLKRRTRSNSPRGKNNWIDDKNCPKSRWHAFFFFRNKIRIDWLLIQSSTINQISKFLWIRSTSLHRNKYRNILLFIYRVFQEIINKISVRISFERFH